MIALAAGVRVYLACGVTDMRKGMTGLAMLVQQGLAADPFDGAVFAFRGRRALSKQTLSRELRAIGYRKLSARPRHHAQRPGAIDDFKKVSPTFWTRSRTQRVSSA